MSRPTMLSLSTKAAVLISTSTILSILAVAFSTLWVFERSLDSQLDNHLVAYNDILVSTIKVENEKVTTDTTNELLMNIPRHWQIDLPDGEVIKSPFLAARIPTQTDSKNGRFSIRIGETSLIAYQQFFDFPGPSRVRVIFALEEEIADSYKSEIKAGFSKYLYGLLLVIAMVFIVVGFIIIAMITKPLRSASHSLRQVQLGNSKRISGPFPSEIADLTNQVNQLLNYTEAVISRHRTFSANVAHVLKTPLAVIRNETESVLIRERVDAMLQVIDRNLARVHISGHKNLPINKTAIKPILQKISDGFARVYEMQIELKCDDQLSVSVDEADLYEILGNLIENACKYGRSKVCVVVNAYSVVVEDDGLGIPSSKHDTVLARGIRLDQAKPGSGIGLAITRDIVELYGGKIMLGKSTKGGLKATIMWKDTV